MAEGYPRRIADYHVRPTVVERQRKRARQISGHIGPHRISARLSQLVKYEIRGAEIVDRFLFLLCKFSFVVFADDLGQSRFDLRPIELAFRSGTQSFYCFVEQGW